MSAEKLITEAVNLEHTLKESQELVVYLLAEIDKLRLELENANTRVDKLIEYLQKKNGDSTLSETEIASELINRRNRIYGIEGFSKQEIISCI